MSPLPVASRSRQWIRSPILLRPTTVDQADRCFDEYEDAQPLGGGLDVVNRMKEGWQPGRLVALAGIDALAHTTLSADRQRLIIGAMVSHDALAGDAVIRQHLPDLAQAWGRIANVRIRMQGTIAGNVFAAVPGYEAAVLLAAMDAQMVWHPTRKAQGESHEQGPLLRALIDLDDPSDDSAARVLSVSSAPPPHPTSEQVTGWVSAFQIALGNEPGSELGSGVSRRLFYDRSMRPALSVALGLDVTDDGTVIAARAVLGGCHPRPIVRLLALAGSPLKTVRLDADAIAQQAFAHMPTATVPWAGDPAYRLRVAPVLLSRLLQESAK